MDIQEQNIYGGNITNISGNQIIHLHTKSDEPWDKIKEGKPYINLTDSLLDKFIGNPGLNMVGREKELEWLAQFKESGPELRIGAICGYGGVGKTRLVLDFFKKSNWDGWRAFATNWSDLKDNGVTKKQIRHNVFFVLDYVMAYADKIGEWMRKLRHNINMEGSAFHVRILLIERAGYGDSQTPYWYAKAILQNNLQDICGKENLLHLTNLTDKELLKIAMQYLSTAPAAGAKPHPGRFLEESEHHISNYLARSASKCKTPLYVLSAADALLNGHKTEQFDQQFFKQYIQKKLKDKIYSVFPKDTDVGNSLENILVYSIAVSGTGLKKSLPDFLAKDFTKLKEKAVSAGGTLKSVLLQLDIIPNEKNNEMYITYESPSITKELYCLEYLQKMKIDNADEENFNNFIQAAWSEKPREFMEFLCRIAEDFPGHKLASMEGVFQCPENLEYENYKYYLEVLREITFWNESKYEDEIIQVFDRLYQNIIRIKGPTSNDAAKIAEIYALCLFNMSWHWYKKIRELNTADDSHGKKYKKRLKRLLSAYPNSETVRQSYDLSEKTELRTMEIKSMQARP